MYANVPTKYTDNSQLNDWYYDVHTDIVYNFFLLNISIQTTHLKTHI